MTTIYLEYSAGHEHKFYETTLDGLTLTVRYGRIGTAGQVQEKRFASPEIAAKEADRKLGEKRRKGYTEAIRGETEKKAVSGPILPLPPLLKPYRTQLESTLRLAVNLHRAEGRVWPWSSKIGGVPYRERRQEWPATPSGDPLAFLAQINFADLPALDGFPTTGIVQFFVADDSMIGTDFSPEGRSLDEAPQQTFRVLYHANPVQDESLLAAQTPVKDWQYLPHDPSVAVLLTGEHVQDVISVNDRLFDALIGIDFLDERETPDGDTLGDTRFGVYVDTFPATTKFGGHPHFTQNDPRGTQDPHVLLFESSSDPKLGVLWGDTGIANFFIRPDDLARLDFSRVFYMWDCS